MAKRDHPLYTMWKGMRARCNNPNHSSYHNYGARGISVCSRWDDFWLFLEDMGERPTPKHTIERLDNSGDYGPDNCVWADVFQQQSNTRKSVFIAANGKTQTLSQWARELKVPVITLHTRIGLGWSDEDVINKPIRKIRKKATPDMVANWADLRESGMSWNTIAEGSGYHPMSVWRCVRKLRRSK